MNKLVGLSTRTYFIGVLIGMAKGFGYTKARLLKEINVGWQHVSDSSPATSAEADATAGNREGG